MRFYPLISTRTGIWFLVSSASVAVCFGNVALAQNLWGDEQLLHAYDNYVACYEQVINSSAIPDVSDRTATTKLFDSALSGCAGEKAAATKVAEARLSKLMPHYSTEQRSGYLATFRRGLFVLTPDSVVRRKGLEAQFTDYLQRSPDF